MTINSINSEQRAQIIKLIKDHVKMEKCCRVGWAAKEVLKQDVLFHIIDKIAADIIYGGKYTRDNANPNFMHDWNIRKNPDYRFRWINLILAIISALGALLSGIFAYSGI